MCLNCNCKLAQDITQDAGLEEPALVSDIIAKRCIHAVSFLGDVSLLSGSGWCQRLQFNPGIGAQFEQKRAAFVLIQKHLVSSLVHISSL